MRGRKPKPTAKKELTGNPGRRPLNQSEPDLGRTSLAPPAWLDKVGKQEWRRLAPVLERNGLLTAGDRQLFAAYCRAYSRLVKAERFLRGQESTVYRTAGGALKPWPQEAIANAAADAMRKLGAEFGFTPSSRSRIELPEDREASSDAFLFGPTPGANECQNEGVN